jgi:hypothetical protein
VSRVISKTTLIAIRATTSQRFRLRHERVCDLARISSFTGTLRGELLNEETFYSPIEVNAGVTHITASTPWRMLW